MAARLGAVAAPLVLCGHTHMPRVAHSGGTLVVNPGSVGLPAFDDDHPHAHRMETGSPHARWALVEHAWRGLAGAAAADRLRLPGRGAGGSAGRGDWADALRTGRVGRTEAEVCG